MSARKFALLLCCALFSTAGSAATAPSDANTNVYREYINSSLFVFLFKSTGQDIGIIYKDNYWSSLH